MTDPKKRADPTGETGPQRPVNRERTSGSKEHLIERSGESDARIDDRRSETDAREQPEGGARGERSGYRNSDEV
jgi:hypothetical protein